MDYKLVNEKLKDLSALRRTKVDKSETENDEYMPTWYEVCPFDGEVFVRLQIQMDSYQENENVIGIEFVKCTQKQVSIYEPVK